MAQKQKEPSRHQLLLPIYISNADKQVTHSLKQSNIYKLLYLELKTVRLFTSYNLQSGRSLFLLLRKRLVWVRPKKESAFPRQIASTLYAPRRHSPQQVQIHFTTTHIDFIICCGFSTRENTAVVNSACVHQMQYLPQYTATHHTRHEIYNSSLFIEQLN